MHIIALNSELFVDACRGLMTQVQEIFLRWRGTLGRSRRWCSPLRSASVLWGE